ncbi:MAG: hypothetical protein COX70_09285 [Flavobacteriales bacterium CG_4_10_14_0_2_um_filter_32_8]|nr:MAG: hypothetical protein COX70_09285 [Flavobacteriales bacterium CG_4_10_14_0_2_um_filter_32_8]
MKKIALFITFCIALLNAYAQESFNQKFLEANTLMEENQHNVALPIWLQLQSEQPDNFNINYKVGVCYIYSANEKKKALDYLVKAVQNSTNNYNPFSASEKKSPVESYFYLAQAYHINNQLDAAMLNYNSFKEKISKKHYLFNEVDHHIEQCKNAKIAMENPVNIKVTNMGVVINSVSADYSPVISIDESSMYFTSRRVRKDSSNYYIKDISDGKHYEDIYVSNNYDGVWSEPELLGINTEGHEATINISADGQTLFIYKDDNGDGNIYISKLEGEEWSAPIKLGSDINLTSRETHAHVTPDGNNLFFVSDRKGGFGGQDIYVCKKLPTGDWSKAQNIGNVINTPYDEDGVFIHPDGKSMYFSSKGNNSIGGYDIFYSLLDDAGNWTKPVNMGYPVNSTDDDVFFVTSTDGKRGYYSSFKETGYGEKDIYKISLEDANAKPVTLLTGFIKVRGMSETPDNAQVVVTNNENGELVGIFKPRKKDGKFSIILAPGNDYHIIYSAATFKQEEDLYIPPISAYQEINRGIDLQDIIFGNPEDTLVTNNTNNNNTNNNNNNTNNNNTNNNTNNNNNTTNNDDELNQLKGIIKTLNAQIADLKAQLAKNNTNTNTNNNEDSRVASLEAIISDLKKQIDLLTNNANTNYVPTGDVIASYQEFFNYNVKSVNTSSEKYIDLINKAVEKSKSSEKVIVEIESSASKVPTKTYGTNSNLAYKRAQDAKDNIIKSLVNKGVKKENIILKNVDSNVNGPEYNSDFNNASVYEKYQYVVIKIK